MVMTRVILLRASSHAVRYPLNLHRQNQAMKMNMDYRQGGVPSLSLSAGMDSSTATNRRGSSICGFLLLKVEELRVTPCSNQPSSSGRIFCVEQAHVHFCEPYFLPIT